MYVIERLKKDFPQHIKVIEEYDAFIRRYHPEEYIYRIFDDQKENYHWLNDAYVAGPGKGCYNKFMAKYEKSLNEDPDFLEFFIKDYFDTDATSFSSEEKIAFVNEKFNKIIGETEK